ncbi:MAG: LacI family DNA-binding transcriptional regulator [Parvularcula sp.]|jgi:DNA-binding LacI/PurR family transcriptional regulator|nr:LacI family DNA-binding transcriptional regulator [Parvularcula sp.]
MAESKPHKLELVEGRASPVTSYDVARHAGVSQSAVSRCFKPGASVSLKMRARVEKAAKELGYEPNAIARSLITKRSNLVAILISNLTNLYYPEVLAELTQKFSGQGMRVLLFSLPSEADAHTVFQQIWPYRVDGVVAAAELSIEEVREFEKRDVPLVFYNRHLSGAPVSSVCCDQEEGARQLVNGLYNAGHRRFAILAGPPESAVGVERKSAAMERLEELGIEEFPVLDGDYSYRSGFDLADQLATAKGGPPEALICANDVMAIGAIDAMRTRHGLKAPEDISVVGFDGVGPAGWESYKVTTIRQPVRRMVDATVSLVMSMIEDPQATHEKRIFSGLFQRGSSARMQIDD